VQKSISVPAHLHGYLIGSGGAQIRKFQEKHQVTVSLDRAQNQAVVRGTGKDVDQAIEEIHQVYFLISATSIAHLEDTDRQRTRS
jgi:rRNA processing protein Krr1/Pno1